MSCDNYADEFSATINVTLSFSRQELEALGFEYDYYQEPDGWVKDCLSIERVVGESLKVLLSEQMKKGS